MNISIKFTLEAGPDAQKVLVNGRNLGSIYAVEGTVFWTFSHSVTETRSFYASARDAATALIRRELVRAEISEA